MHRVFFADEATAVAAGYRPCARCLPEPYRDWRERANSAAPAIPSAAPGVVERRPPARPIFQRVACDRKALRRNGQHVLGNPVSMDLIAAAPTQNDHVVDPRGGFAIGSCGLSFNGLHTDPVPVVIEFQ